MIPFKRWEFRKARRWLIEPLLAGNSLKSPLPLADAWEYAERAKAVKDYASARYEVERKKGRKPYAKGHRDPVKINCAGKLWKTVKTIDKIFNQLKIGE